jgi:hypothetical protein
VSYDPADPLRNLSDPLHGSAAEASLELFRRISRAASQLPSDAVIDAACALLVNAVRQQCTDWSKAEALIDEYFGKSKNLLRFHYNDDGRKRGVFPFDQSVVANIVRPDDKAQM